MNRTTLHQKCSFLLKMSLLLFAFASTSVVFAQQKKDSGADDETLLNQFVQSKGYVQTIVFDSKIIKQFWIDRNIISRNNVIEVFLSAIKNKRQTLPQNIQLANVIETQDCKVDIITENRDMSFSVVDSKGKVLSSSSQTEEFLQYSIASSEFHIEDLNGFSFGIVFSSEKSDVLRIKKIILSFSRNENSAYAGSPGFDRLLKQIDEEGVEIPQVYENGEVIPNSEARYLISKENNKMYLKIPTKQAIEDCSIIYRVFPVDKKNIENSGDFNVCDFSLKSNKVAIPKPYLSKSPFTIVQCTLPAYKISKIRLGMITKKEGEARKRMWFINITNIPAE